MLRAPFPSQYRLAHPLNGGVRILTRNDPRLGKTMLDKAIAALACIALAPLMALICIIIKLDSRGPVLFVQQRHGLDNKVIRVFKFRTMYSAHCQDYTAAQAVRDDRRVTRAGRLLRSTSLDELPQLLNVLKGDMSIVGPRPHPLLLNERFSPLIPGYDKRHTVKPGITGWAQVNGWRGETDTVAKMQGRVDHDLYYVENWSFVFDLRIIASTALLGWVGKNAY